MPPDFVNRKARGETAVLRLDEVLHGVQEETNRRFHALPPALTQVAFSEAVIDSRQATSACLFVALRGERVDGHEFLADAAARGARGAWCAARKCRTCRWNDLLPSSIR